MNYHIPTIDEFRRVLTEIDKASAELRRRVDAEAAELAAEQSAFVARLTREGTAAQAARFEKLNERVGVRIESFEGGILTVRANGKRGEIDPAGNLRIM